MVFYVAKWSVNLVAKSVGRNPVIGTSIKHFPPGLLDGNNFVRRANFSSRRSATLTIFHVPTRLFSALSPPPRPRPSASSVVRCNGTFLFSYFIILFARLRFYYNLAFLIRIPQLLGDDLQYERRRRRKKHATTYYTMERNLRVTLYNIIYSEKRKIYKSILLLRKQSLGWLR